MKTKYIIIGLIIILLIIFLTQNKEHAGSTSQKISNEAVQNIAKVYADSKILASFNGVIINGELKLPKWKGMITMWSGDINNIPKGWALCDGQIINGLQTPDLRGRFILGYGKGDNLTERKMKDKGGEEKHVLLEEELPRHTHKWADFRTGDDDCGGAHTYTFKGDNQTQTTIYQHDCGEGGDANSISEPETSRTGNNVAHENMPPYFVLAYIIKTT